MSHVLSAPAFFHFLSVPALDFYFLASCGVQPVGAEDQNVRGERLGDLLILTVLVLQYEIELGL